MTRSPSAHVASMTWCFAFCLVYAAFAVHAQDIPTLPPVVYPSGAQFYTRQTIHPHRPFVQRYWYICIIALVIGVFFLYSLLIIIGCVHFRWLEQKRARRLLYSRSDSRLRDVDLSTTLSSTSASEDDELSSDEEQDASSTGHASLFSLSRTVSDSEDDDDDDGDYASTLSLSGYGRGSFSTYSHKSSHRSSSSSRNREGRFGVLK